VATLTSAARDLLDDATAADMRTTLGVTASGSVQPLDATLTALAGVSTAADKVPYFTGTDAADVFTVTSAARDLLDDANAAAMLTTLGALASADVAADADFQAATANKILTAGILNTANAPEASSSGSAWTPDLDTARCFIRTLTASQAINNPTNPRAGQSGLIFITQTGTGAYDITSWGSYWNFPQGTPALDTGQNAINTIGYYVRTTTDVVCVYLGTHTV
jgi:hypothetical protein